MPRITRRSVLVLLAGAPALSESGAADMRRIEQEVVAAYLNSLVVPDQQQIKTLILSSATATADEAFVGSGSRFARLSQDFPEATRAVIEDFLAVTQTSTTLLIPSELVRRELRWQVASERRLNRIFDLPSLEQAWEQFYKEYPQATGVTRFSRVGVDGNSTQALLYFSMTPGGLGGAGFFVLMHRRLGIWRVLSSKQAWIS